jgi:hypothetical protein
LTKWHFLTHAFLWAKLLLLKCFESATKRHFPKNISGSVQVHKTADKSGKIGLFQKFNIAFEKSFLILVPMII